LTNHPWKGNVRELANFLERAVVLSQGEELKVPTGEFIASYSPETTTPPNFEQAAREVIMDALRAASGRVAGKGGALERLGLKRTTLQNKMRKLGINRAKALQDSSQDAHTRSIASHRQNIRLASATTAARSKPMSCGKTALD
jgi:DNA-binding NtrC family response regulator